jgi:hypothetical protein
VPDIAEYGWNQIEKKINKSDFGCIHFTTTFDFEYGYPYLHFNGHRYQIIRIPFPYFHPYPERFPTNPSYFPD